jgi:hypothetical protein
MSGMRGDDRQPDAMFSYVSAEQRVPNRSRALLVLLLGSQVAACGGGHSPTVPSRQYFRDTETVSGPIDAHGSFCWNFTNARAGAVYASATPRSLRVILATGTCAAPGQILAEADGEVSNIEAPAGVNHVTLSTQSDVATSFSLSLTHWY